MAKTAIRTVDQRWRAGKSRRVKCPRASHSNIGIGRGNKRDIVALIKASNHDRVESLIPIRHGRMLQSEFAFFRGTAALQAHDLRRAPASGIIVQACGDCHLLNFGGFASPERTLIFDINDFDETFPGPWEWDLKRLGASLVLAARDRRFSSKIADKAVAAAAQSYRERISEFAAMRVLDSWYAQLSADIVKQHFRNADPL